MPAMPVVGLQRGMDLWGDDAAFCQITLTSCIVFTSCFTSVSHLSTSAVFGYTEDNISGLIFCFYQEILDRKFVEI